MSGALHTNFKQLREYRSLVEHAGKFIMIQGEEISDSAEGKPVHMNATNISQVLPPAGGATVRESMQNNLRMDLEHERQTGRQILPHLNHPNFGYAITAGELASVVEERFFEVYNGHPSVNQLGDDPSRVSGANYRETQDSRLGVTFLSKSLLLGFNSNLGERQLSLGRTILVRRILSDGKNVQLEYP